MVISGIFPDGQHGGSAHHKKKGGGGGSVVRFFKINILLDKAKLCNHYRPKKIVIKLLGTKLTNLSLRD
jgi:hypothetical protein